MFPLAELISQAAGNVVTPQVNINVQRAAEGSRPFFLVTLDQVTMERIELSESDQMVERVVMAPRAIRIEYKSQDDTGGISPPIVTTIAC